MARGRRLNHQRPAIPTRRCVGCRKPHPAPELLRIAALAGQAVPDPGRRMSGRGAWICKKTRCAEAAAKGRQVSRALKGKAAEPSSAELMRWITVALPLTPDPASG